MSLEKEKSKGAHAKSFLEDEVFKTVSDDEDDGF